MTQPRDDDDELFRQIVAGFGTEPTEQVPRWPVSEDDDGPAEPEPPAAAPPAPAAEEGLPAWVEPEALPDEGHYIPPPPPRLGRLRWRTVGAIALFVLGMLALFAPATLGMIESTGTVLLGMLMLGSCGALLVGSLREGPGHDDRPDDGAVV